MLEEERLAAWADRHGKWLALSGQDVRKADAWFDRHGGKVVLFARLVPGVRSLISVPAGMSNMNMVKFLLYTALGTGVWAPTSDPSLTSSSACSPWRRCGW